MKGIGQAMVVIFCLIIVAISDCTKGCKEAIFGKSKEQLARIEENRLEEEAEDKKEAEREKQEALQEEMDKTESTLKDLARAYYWDHYDTHFGDNGNIKLSFGDSFKTLKVCTFNAFSVHYYLANDGVIYAESKEGKAIRIVTSVYGSEEKNTDEYVFKVPVCSGDEYVRKLLDRHTELAKELQ